MIDEFTARVRIVAALAVIELLGELDADTAHILEDRLDGVVAQVPGDVIIDCAGLGFVDSSGLNVMTLARHRLEAVGRTLWIHGPSASFKRLLSISGLDALLREIDALPTEASSRVTSSSVAVLGPGVGMWEPMRHRGARE